MAFWLHLHVIWWWFGSSWSYCWQAFPQEPMEKQVAMWTQHGVGTFTGSLNSFDYAVYVAELGDFFPPAAGAHWANLGCLQWQLSSWLSWCCFAALAEGPLPSFSTSGSCIFRPLCSTAEVSLRAAATLDTGLTHFWPHAALSVQTHGPYQSWHPHLSRPPLSDGTVF